jgi:hypothetical protein
LVCFGGYFSNNGVPNRALCANAFAADNHSIFKGVASGSEHPALRREPPKTSRAQRRDFDTAWQVPVRAHTAEYVPHVLVDGLLVGTEADDGLVATQQLFFDFVQAGALAVAAHFTHVATRQDLVTGEPALQGLLGSKRRVTQRG